MWNAKENGKYGLWVHQYHFCYQMLTFAAYLKTS